jgi:hypothetical protein
MDVRATPPTGGPGSVVAKPVKIELLNPIYSALDLSDVAVLPLEGEALSRRASNFRTV